VKNFLKLDLVLGAAIALLLGVGILALYSISFSGNVLVTDHFYRQLEAAVVGIFLMLIFSFFDYRVLSAYSTKLYFAMLVILSLVLAFGTTVRGTTGWIGFANLHIQPVEATKIIMIIFLASFFSKKKTKLSENAKIAVSIILVFIPVFLILRQPDFGSAAVTAGIWGGMLLVSEISKKNICILFLAISVLLGGSYFFMKDYQKERLQNFINPANDPLGSGYNVAQSMVAVGSGGIFGKGLGHGPQSQLNFLPEKHTDFIFASIAEELGLVGALFVIFLFGVLLYRMKKTAHLARDNFGFLVVVGVIIMFFLQILINIGMNMGINPVAGVPLPLLSYGGSSLVTILISLGLVQSVYLRRIKALD
jgi:rod shape determining protein RodA